MQRHLRKIRKDNISNNNYFGYTSFAILEVVLIVVGIFLAIQLDNANNQSKVKPAFLWWFTTMKTGM